MATELKLRRDVEADILAGTPAEGEPVYVTDEKQLRLGDGSTAGGTVFHGAADIRAQKASYVAVSGTNSLTGTLDPALAAHVAGTRVCVKIANDNTGAVDLDLGPGSRSVKKLKDGAVVNLDADDFRAGGIYDLVDDGSRWLVIGGVGGSQAGWEVVATIGSGTSAAEFTLPDGYDAFQIEIMGVTTSTTANLRFRFKDSGGEIAGGSDYGDATARVIGGADTNAVAGGSNTSSYIDISSGTNSSDSHAVTFSGTIRHHRHASLLAQISGHGMVYDTANRPLLSIWGGTLRTAYTVTGVKIYPSAGTLESGTILIRGIRNGA